MTEPVHGVLVGCGEAKRDGVHEARELYTSNYFDLKRRYAETHGDLWRVVSAEYGLVRPDERVETYDTTLDDMSLREEYEWLNSVATELHDLHLSEDVDHWTVLAGGEYARALDEVMLSIRVSDYTVPTDGLRIGERMEWLASEVDDQEERLAAAGAGGGE